MFIRNKNSRLGHFNHFLVLGVRTVPKKINKKNVSYADAEWATYSFSNDLYRFGDDKWTTRGQNRVRNKAVTSRR